MTAESIEEKTPTANAILTEAGEIIAQAKELSDRARNKNESRAPCDVAICEASFATKVAKHLHRVDSEWCKDHARVNDMADDIAYIKRLARWTLGILCAVVGSGGVYQLWQLIVWAVKRFAVLVIAVSLASCFRSAEKSATTETTHRVGIEAGKPVDVVETRKTETASERETKVDIGPAVAAAVKAATGDLVGAVTSLASQAQAFMSAPKPEPEKPITGSSLLDALIAAMGGYAAIKGTVAAGRKLTMPKK